MRCSKRRPWELAAAVGLIVVLAGLPGCGPAAEREPAMTMEEACRPVRSKEDPAVARLRRALRTPIDVAFDKTPLDKALKVIGAKAGVAIFPDPDLATSGIDISSRYVWLAVDRVPADEVLYLVLSGDMAYVVEVDRVLVTTRDAALHKMPCVLYPVADLVRSGAPEPQIGYVEQRDIIKQYVNNMSDRGVAAWTDEGGPATMDYYDGVFFVTQTPRGHERIMDLLTVLRKAKAQAGSSEPVRMAETAGAKHICQRLAERIDVDFEKVSLSEVLEHLRKTQESINIVVDPDLGGEGIDLTTRVVTLKCKQAPIGEILSFALGHDLAYRVYPHHVLVSTRAKLYADLPMVMYPILDVVKATAGESPLGKPFGAGVGEDVLAVGWQEAGDIIKHTVNNMTDPNVAAWTDEGGSAAMDHYDGVLIVTQTPEGHERIMDFLTVLRKAEAQAGSSEPVRMPETAGAKHIRRRLAERIDVDFENAPLLGVLDSLREALKDVNLVLAPDLDKAGIDLTLRDAVLKCKQAPIGEILSFALGHDLAYRVYPHHVLVSTRAKLYADLLMVMYPILDVVKATAGESPLGKPFGAGVGEDVLAVGWQEVGDIIKHTVNNMTDPNVAGWADEGGPASIEYYDGLFVVTQTPEGHERIAELLNLLRQGLARVERQLQE